MLTAQLEIRFSTVQTSMSIFKGFVCNAFVCNARHSYLLPKPEKKLCHATVASLVSRPLG